jgi:regulation of enolase protein 1 (concanavalin A-like superfamily)
MTTIRRTSASMNSVDSLPSSGGRRPIAFFAAVLALAGLAVGAEPTTPTPQDSEAQSREPHQPPTQVSEGPAAVVQDSFDGKLGLGWLIFNSLASHWSLSKNPGTLTITTCGGTFTRSRLDYRNLFLLDCPAGPGQDFEVTTCLVSFRPTDLWNQAGLILWNDVDNFLTLVYEWGEGPPGLGQENQRMFTACVESNGSPVFSWYYAPQEQEEVWLRIVKTRSQFELFTSKDGATFTPLQPMRARGVVNNLVAWGNGTIRRVGLFAGNGGALEAKSVDVSFDSFEIKLLETKQEIQTPSSIFQLSDILGRWSCRQNPYHGDFVLKRDGTSCTGILNDVYEGTRGDRIVNVVVIGDHIAFTRRGAFGVQFWEGTLKKENGTLKIVDGRWRRERGGPVRSFTAEKKNDENEAEESSGKPDVQTGGAVNLGPNVNSGYNEGSPDISADGMTLYFDALGRPGGMGGWDIWMSQTETPYQDFAPATPLAAPVNSPFDESGPCLSDDGLTLYFASNRPGGLGSFDLWMATRKTTGDPWDEPVNLGPTVNSPYYDNRPSVSADGLTLYFDSSRPGAAGQSGLNDIYMTKRATTNDPWGEPEPLVINTEEHEFSPDITRDGLTLYYDSYQADRDLWVTRRTATNEAWPKGVPLTAFNTPGIDTDPSISANSSLLYFVSDRPGGHRRFSVIRTIAPGWNGAGRCILCFQRSFCAAIVFVLGRQHRAGRRCLRRPMRQTTL